MYEKIQITVDKYSIIIVLVSPSISSHNHYALPIPQVVEIFCLDHVERRAKTLLGFSAKIKERKEERDDRSV